MELDEIIKFLKTLNEQAVPDSRITCLKECEDQKGIRGASYAKKFRAIELGTTLEACYVVKYPRNVDPINLPPEVCELICTRIGQHLFSPPLCPPFAIAAPLEPSQVRSREGFGSKYLQGYDRVKLEVPEDREKVKSLPPPLLARIIVFHLWLFEDDPEVIINENEKQAFSIDHSFFLKWNEEMTAREAEAYTDLLTVINDQEIQEALKELESIDQKKIIEQFAFLPKKWTSLSTEVIAFRASKILERQENVRAVIKSMREK